MAAVPEGENVYDVGGTVLYRIVDEREHRAERLPTAIAAGSSSQAQAADMRLQPPSQLRSGSTATLGTFTGSRISGGAKLARMGGRGGLGLTSTSTAACGAATTSPARLAPLTTTTSAAGASVTAAGGAAASTIATAITASAAAGTGDDTTYAALLALDRLFPPVPLDEDGNEIDPEEDADDTGDGKSGSCNDGYKSGGGAARVGGGSRIVDASSQRRASAKDPTASATFVATSNGLLADSTLAAAAANGTQQRQPQWIRVAATDHVSRLDVILLKQHLERRCVEENARPRGTLCPARARIYNDGMHELIRQVTVTCPERGLLLQSLCDSMDQTTGTYDALFDSARQYAARKSTERDLKQHLLDDRRALEKECRRCENRLHELRAKYAGMRKRFDEQKAAADKVRESEISYVKLSNQQIVAEIKRVMTSMEGATEK